MLKVYGIGNPLIDCISSITEVGLDKLGLKKGTMLLIDSDKQKEILSYIKNENISYSCGGSCPNTMVTLSSLGLDVTLLGSVGNDDLGKTYKEKLKESGVKDELVLKDDASTGSSIILLTDDKERTMNTYLGANRLLSPSDLNEESLKKADLFYFTGYMWDTESQKNTVLKALKICKEKGIKVAFDIADPFAVGRYRQQFYSIITTYCDIVFANKEEARYLMDNYDAYECAKSMGKLCPVAVVKDGKRGSYISEKRVMHKIPLYGPSTPVDTTGAGDTYAAGFLYGYLTGRKIEECGCIASFLAGEIIKKIGAQFSSDTITLLKQQIEKEFPIA